MDATRLRRTVRWGVIGALVWSLLGGGAAADARTNYLIRLLNNSGAFRVRTQAALALGKADARDRVIGALERALEDDHSAVRTAAATSLQRLGDPQALDALRKARKDKDAAVRRAVQRAIRKLQRIEKTRPRRAEKPERGGERPTADAQYYIGVGMPGARADEVDRRTLKSVRGYLKKRVKRIDGVVLAPDRESRQQARRELQKGELSGYYIDSSVLKVQENGDGTRVEVSVILNTYPGRDMRAMLQGAATVPGGSGASAREQAMKGAIRGALRRLPQALSAAEARR